MTYVIQRLRSSLASGLMNYDAIIANHELDP